jgi:lipopolysaccharide biosynthesis protein
MYVTIPSDIDAPIVETLKPKIQVFCPHAEILIVENRGMDGGGWLAAVNHIIKKDLHYDYMLKIHSKGGPDALSDAWRRVLLDAIIGTKDRAEECLSTLRENPNVGMIGSRGMFLVEGRRRDVETFSKRLGLPPRNRYIFVAGTMFWARFEILAQPFRNLDMDLLLGELSYGKPKKRPGTKDWESHGHWMERIFGNLVSNAGYQFEGLRTDLPDPFVYYFGGRPPLSRYFG